MKDFLKYTFATFSGMVLFFVVTGLIGTFCILGILFSEKGSSKVSDNAVLVINLSGELLEREDETLLSGFSGAGPKVIGLEDILSAINKAKTLDEIKGIYIKSGVLSSDSYASLEAIRDELLEFKKSGKWILSYADVYTQGTYYVCSVADKVLLNSTGQLDWHGISSQPIFLKDFLKKFGVKIQLAKVGTYKSSPERYTADKMSDANREQVTTYVRGIWKNIREDVSKQRGVSPEDLNQYADSMILFASSEDYLKLNLIDGLVYASGVKEEINSLLGKDKNKDINFVSLSDIKEVKDSNSGKEIAVYYAFGEIVESEDLGMLSGSNQIVNKKVCEDLKRLRDDDKVKAVVLRVNSGGGSAFASEQIWHSIEMLKEKKPVVVSMGGMAASGAYYISSAASYIVAQRSTLTGSIGIFGMFPDFSELLTKKLDIKFDYVATNKYSTFGALSRPFNAEEMSYIEKYITRGYQLFLDRVAKGRGMTPEQVDMIAQGRVWIASDAKRVGLVDTLGGLDVAVKKAASLSHLKKYHTKSYPERKDFLNLLMEELSSDNKIDSKMQELLGEYYEPLYLLNKVNLRNSAQARIPFIVNIK